MMVDMKIRLIRGETSRDLAQIPYSMIELQETVFKYFDNTQLTFVYLSLEGELLEIDSDQSLKYALDSMRSVGQKILVILLEDTQHFHRYMSEPNIYAELPKPKPDDGRETYSAELVGEPRIKPGERLKPGQPQFQQWTAKNTGKNTWNNVTLEKIEGNINGNAMKIKSIPPGDEINLCVAFTPTVETSRPYSIWRLKANKTFFGPKLELRIVVPVDEIKYLTDMGFNEQLATEAVFRYSESEQRVSFCLDRNS